jgi:hypothetical protein
VSHDALLILYVLGAVTVLWLVWRLYKWASLWGRMFREFQAEVAKANGWMDSLATRAAEIRRGEHEDAMLLCDRIAALNAVVHSVWEQLKALNEFTPKYAAIAEPISAIPNILTEQVKTMQALGGIAIEFKKSVAHFSKMVTGSGAGSGVQQPDDEQESQEDEVQRLMEHHRAKGHPISRQEAIDRVNDRLIWKQAADDLAGTGTDE